MNGYRVNGLWDPRHHEHNARVAEAHMDAEHWERDLSASEFYADPTTSAKKTNLSAAEVASLPNTATPADARISWGILRPRFALDGIWRVRFWFCHSATSQAAVATLEGRAIVTGATNLGTTGTFSTSITFQAATGGTKRVLELDVDSVGMLADQQHSLLEWRLTRNSADAGDGTATLYIRRIQCYYTPRRQEI